MAFASTPFGFLLSVLLSAVVLIVAVHSLVDPSTIKEGPCITPPVLDKKDIQWMFAAGVKQWYVPLSSQYQAYKTAAEFLQKPIESITDEELASACLICKADKTIGFGGKELIPENNFLRDGVLESKYKGTNAHGTNYFTLTDKKSYFVIIGYWHDTAERSWMVASTQPAPLDEKVKKRVLKHVAKFGFDTTKAHENSYESCTGIVKDEL